MKVYNKLTALRTRLQWKCLMILRKISGVIISGDMVMESPVHADSSEGRMINFYDGRFHISRKNFDKLAAPGLSSYEAQKLD